MDVRNLQRDNRIQLPATKIGGLNTTIRIAGIRSLLGRWPMVGHVSVFVNDRRRNIAEGPELDPFGVEGAAAHENDDVA